MIICTKYSYYAIAVALAFKSKIQSTFVIRLKNIQYTFVIRMLIELHNSNPIWDDEKLYLEITRHRSLLNCMMIQFRDGFRHGSETFFMNEITC